MNQACLGLLLMIGAGLYAAAFLFDLRILLGSAMTPGWISNFVYLALIDWLTALMEVLGGSLGLWLIARRHVSRIGIPVSMLALNVFILFCYAAAFFCLGLAGFLLPPGVIYPALIAGKACLQILLMVAIFLFPKRVFNLSWGRAAAAFICIGVFSAVAAFIPLQMQFLFLRNHIVQARFIASDSCKPALLAGDRVLVAMADDPRPQLGEIWVFIKPQDRPLDFWRKLRVSYALLDDQAVIKRIAGLPGDHVRLVPGLGLEINGQLRADWPFTEPPFWIFECEVPPGHVFMLGDNSNHSLDSRSYGCVPFERLLGRAVYIFYPFHRAGPVE